MELNANQRETLANELIKAKGELGLRLSFEGNNITDDFKDYLDIHLFLLKKRVSLIESILDSNEIDF